MRRPRNRVADCLRSPRVLRQAPRGLVPALEAAQAHARAPYLARMDADDVALPDRLDAPQARLSQLTWRANGGFGVDASVRIEGEDRAGLERGPLA